MNEQLRMYIRERFGSEYSQEAIAFEEGYKAAEKGLPDVPLINTSRPPLHVHTQWMEMLAYQEGHQYFQNGSKNG